MRINDNHVWLWLGFTVIMFVVLSAYAPSFLHVARSDQVNYLAEVADRQSWFSLAIQTYDLNRHRLITPGDDMLFRPLTYFILGNEKYFFGYNFLYWQIAGVAAHLWVVWGVLRLLLTITPSVFAVAVAGFFALLFINMEMVTWHHITSYMVFLGLMLNVLYHAYRYAQEKQYQPRRLWLMLMYLLAAVFIYEAGNIFAAMIFVYLWVSLPSSQRRGLGWFWLPAVCYGVASTANFVLTHVHAPEAPEILSPLSISDVVKNLGMAYGWWLYSGLFPNAFDVLSIARNIVPQQSQLMRPLYLGDVSNLLGLALVGMFIVFLIAGYRKEFIKERGRFLILLTAMLLAYALVIVWGRGHSRIFRLVLGGHFYYNYIFWAFAVVLAYAALPLQFISDKFKGIVRPVVMAVLISAIAVNGVMVYRSVEKQAKENNYIGILIKTLDLLIQEHGQEPGFSFYVAPNFPGNYVYRALKKTNDPQSDEDYNFIQALYPKYYTKTNPKYKLLTPS